MATGEVNYRIRADASGMNAELSKAARSVEGVDKAQQKAERSARSYGQQSSSIDKLKKSFLGLGTAIGALGVGVAFRKMLENTARQEAAMVQLNTTLQSTQFAAGKTADELIKTAAGLQKVTKYGDEAIIEMQALLLTFKDVKGDNFDRTSEAILDMATAMKTDLKSATIQLGKALNDPARNLSALTRSGIQFNEAQTEMIKQMQATGDLAGAQTIILKELESQFGGSARAARDTLGGALAGLSNAYNDLFEADKRTTEALVKNINKLESALASKALQDSMSLFASTLGVIADNMGRIAKYSPANLYGKLIAGAIDYARELGLVRDELDSLGDSLTETTDLTRILSEIDLTLIRRKKEVGRVIGGNTDGGPGTGGVTGAVKVFNSELEELTRTVGFLSGYSGGGGPMAGFAGYMGVLAGKTAEAEGAIESAGDTAQDAGEDFDAMGRRGGDAGQALTQAFSEARSVLSDMFFEMARDGKDAFETLTEGFERMLAKMLAEAAANEILLQFGNAAGGLGYGGIASAALSQVSGTTFSGLFGGSSAVGEGAAEGAGATASASSVAGSSLFATAGYAAIVAGAYKAISEVSEGKYGFGDIITGNSFDIKYRDELNDLMGGLGDVLGDIHKMAAQGGPSQFITGKIFGTNLADLIGDALGGKSNAAGRVSIDLAGRQTEAFGVGNSFSSKNVDALDEVSNALFEFANLLGGSSAVLDVWLGRADGFRLFDQEGEKLLETKNNRDFFNYAKDLIVQGAEGLTNAAKQELLDFSGSLEEIFEFAALTVSLQELEAQLGALPDSIRQLIDGFVGTDEQIREFSAAVLDLHTQSQFNSVTQAIEDFGRAIPTALDGFREQNQLLDTLITNFDGSGLAAQELANALAESKVRAYDFAIAIQSVGKELAEVAAAQAESIRESVLTTEELRAKRLEERETLTAALESLVDPAQIEETTRRILELNRQIFDSLSEEERLAQSETFATFAETTSDVAQGLLEASLERLRSTQDEINARVSDLLSQAAARQQEAADIQLEAAQLFMSGVQQLNASNAQAALEEVGQ